MMEGVLPNMRTYMQVHVSYFSSVVLLSLCLFLSFMRYLIYKVHKKPHSANFRRQPSRVQGNILDKYVQTNGAWIDSLQKNQYRTLSKEECAEKCDGETEFICRSFIFAVKVETCTTLPDNSKTAHLFRKADAILFEKRIFLLNCRRGNGYDYRGTISTTRRGVTCQRWASNSPHVPNYSPRTHPNASLEKNFCRNPDNDEEGPWCYTTDPETRFDYCNIPECEVGKTIKAQFPKQNLGFSVRLGILKNLTLMDTFLQIFQKRISSQITVVILMASPVLGVSPPAQLNAGNIATFHGVLRLHQSPSQGASVLREGEKTIEGMSMSLLQEQNASPGQPRHLTNMEEPQKPTLASLEENYCRNPDGETSPWCYTTDPNKRWEYCNIPSCGAVVTAATTAALLPVKPAQPTFVEDCYRGNGEDYRGTASLTVSGKKCQAWWSMKPHPHTKTPSAYPEADLRRNYCRNPDKDDNGPWCFTTDSSTRWEYCNLQKCTDQVQQEPTASENMQTDCRFGNGKDYRGKIAVTVSGKSCQEWRLQTPHKHDSFTPLTHPRSGLERNYCRNPDSDNNGPWCYTKDPRTAWEYCDIPQCRNFCVSLIHSSAPPEYECGKAKYKPALCYGRIVGGCVSNPHSWPWQISLRLRILDAHFCGGTLISPQWVLTATHCLQRSSRASTYKVAVGSHTERALEPSTQHRDIEKIFKEPNGADIALLKLSSPVLITNEVIPACLPSVNAVVPGGAECYVTGWGDTKGTGGEGLLKETGFPVIENKVCNRPDFLGGRVRTTELCAGNIDGGTDSCQGDSGGPLVCEEQGKYIVHGVTSWGLGCAEAMKPGVYVRVSRFIPWIERTMRENDLVPILLEGSHGQLVCHHVKRVLDWIDHWTDPGGFSYALTFLYSDNGLLVTFAFSDKKNSTVNWITGAVSSILEKHTVFSYFYQDAVVSNHDHNEKTVVLNLSSLQKEGNDVEVTGSVAAIQPSMLFPPAIGYF
ncbi:Plasminogen [Varanus komodoensis]|nr:Plasminogen [Varanus komodoensis]